LANTPATPAEVSQRLQINRRAARALLGLLASADLLVQHDGRYHLTETARTYLLPSSPYYWGPVLSMMRRVEFSYASVMAALKAPEAASRWEQAGTPVHSTFPADSGSRWESQAWEVPW